MHLYLDILKVMKGGGQFIFFLLIQTSPHFHLHYLAPSTFPCLRNILRRPLPVHFIYSVGFYINANVWNDQQVLISSTCVRVGKGEIAALLLYSQRHRLPFLKFSDFSFTLSIQNPDTQL